MIDWLNPFGRVMDVIDEVVEDKDKVNEIRGQIEKGAQKLVEMQEVSYQIALQQKTIPLVDALHKMGRQILSYLGYGLAFYMVTKNITDPVSLAACFAPSTAYNYVKGAGK